MSVKKIQERICVSKNDVLEAKLHKITQRENIDNYSLNMISDNYEFRLIYAISGMVLAVVKFQEKLCILKKSHAELILA
jgi:hypothetical protein